MSSALPVVSGPQAISVLESVGYVAVRQRGSHVRLRHPDAKDHRPVTVPLHSELKRGLLKSILRDAGITTEDFMALL